MCNCAHIDMFWHLCVFVRANYCFYIGKRVVLIFYSSNLSGMLSCSPHMSKVHELQIRYINFLCKSGSAPSLFSSFPFLTVFNFILLFQYHHYCRRRWLRGLVVIHPRPWLQAKAASNCLFIAITIHCDDDHHNHNHNHHPLSSWSCFESYGSALPMCASNTIVTI